VEHRAPIPAARRRCGVRGRVLEPRSIPGDPRGQDRPAGPVANPYVDRLIGTLRRECLDHVVVLNEIHLRHLLGDYLIYYTAPEHTCPWARAPQSHDQWSASSKAGSSRRPWSAACIIATAGWRRKLLSAHCPGYVEVAGWCVVSALNPVLAGSGRSQGFPTLGARHIRSPLRLVDQGPQPVPQSTWID
jgi:hypothetical protein